MFPCQYSHFPWSQVDASWAVSWGRPSSIPTSWTPAGCCGWRKGKSNRTKIYCYKAAEKLHGLQWIVLKQSPENHSQVVLSNSNRNQRNYELQFQSYSLLSPLAIQFQHWAQHTTLARLWFGNSSDSSLLEVVESCLVLWWIDFESPGAPEEGRWLEGAQDSGWRWYLGNWSQIMHTTHCKPN